MLQQELVKEFWGNTNKVLLDSKPLFLFLVGTINPNLIKNFKRLRVFHGKEVETFEALLIVLEPYKEIITLPNILTEICNLANQADFKSQERFYKYLSKLLYGKMNLLDEKYVKSKLVVRNEYFLRLHLTDSAIIKLIEKENIGTVTMDLGLYLELSKHKFPVLNFNHIVPWLT